jgi:hypothetical protein
MPAAFFMAGAMPIDHLHWFAHLIKQAASVRTTHGKIGVAYKLLKNNVFVWLAIFMQKEVSAD